jgi:NADH-quinone oxidoreductase subunit M
VFALLAVLAGTGVIFAAVYLLLATQRVFFGPIRHAENEKLEDLSTRELVVMVPLVIVAVVMGLYPKPFLDSINPTVAAYARDFRARANIAPLRDADLAAALEVRASGSTTESSAPSLPAGSKRPSLAEPRLERQVGAPLRQRTGLPRRLGAAQQDQRIRARRGASVPKLPWRRAVDARRERARQEGTEP